MAKVESIISLKGSLDQLVFYKVNGKTVCRTKDPNKPRDFRESEAYENSRKCSSLFKACNAMATAIYRMAKASGVKIDYRKHSELVKLIYQHFYSTPNALPERMTYQELQRALCGFGFANKHDTSSVPVISTFHDDGLHLRFLDNLSSVKLLFGKGTTSTLTEMGYLVENTMVEVMEVDMNDDEVVVDVGDDVFVMVVCEDSVWVC